MICSPSLTIVLPFSIPMMDYLSTLENHPLMLPKLKKIIQYIDQYSSVYKSDIFCHDVSHERWLAHMLGLSQLPHAALLLASEKNMNEEQMRLGWAVLQPVHLHVALDHLVLDFHEKLNLTTDEAYCLFEVARPILESLSSRLLAPTPMHWYIGDEQISMLRLCSPLRTVGRNIDLWVPYGTEGRIWRKLQNEIQMLWHDHPVNQARIERGDLPINGIWLFGSGSLPQLPLSFPFSSIFSNNPLLLGISKLAHKKIAALPYHFDDIYADSQQLENDDSDLSTLIWFDDLISPATQQDWTVWLKLFSEIEHNWLEPAYRALCRRHLKQLTLVLMSEQGWLTLIPKANDWWKFWRRRDWVKLLSQVAVEL